MSKVKRLLAFVLVVTMLMQILPLSAAASLVGKIVGGKAIIQNDYIKVTVDTKTGRFGIRTVEGQPVRKNDQNTSLTFGGDDPETSFTTFRINGTDYIFGNSYDIDASHLGFKDPIISELGETKIVTPEEYPDYVPEGCQAIMTPWEVEGVEITQIILLYPEVDKQNGGNVNIYYYIKNTTNAAVEVGSRILLDTQVGANDGPEFQIGTISSNTLRVERMLTPDPINDQNISPDNVYYYKLPDYWVMKDTLDSTNPLATNVVAYGYTDIDLFRDLDYIIVGHWNHLANYKYDMDKVNRNLDFTNDKNDYGTADSAVAFYWQPKTIAAGSSDQLGTIYGLGEIIDPTSVLSITFPSPVTQTEVNDDGSAYKNDGIFTINVEVTNLEMYDMKHDYIDITMTLESGLRFVKVDKYGNIVRDGDGNPEVDYGNTKTLCYEKSLTPEQSANGEKNPVLPGESIAATFTVMATGKPWPTTRQYMVTASSPQLEMKFETQYGSSASEDVKALYNASRANFIFLPSVGEGTPTQTLEVTPEECYMKDDKYLSITMTNIEAYNPGSNLRSQKSDPNFDLYLVEKVTGARYKVDVTESVTTVVTDDGLTGEMRVGYKKGTQVDSNGNPIAVLKTPELPLGEYYVEVDYISNDEDENYMLDVTSEQTFIVTDNEQARIREPAILAIFKSTMNFGSGSLIKQFENLINEVNNFMDNMNDDSSKDQFMDSLLDGVFDSLKDMGIEMLQELASPLMDLLDQFTGLFRFDAEGIEALNEALEKYPELNILDFSKIEGYDVLDAIMNLVMGEDSADDPRYMGNDSKDSGISFNIKLKNIDLDAIFAGPADASGECTTESVSAWLEQVMAAVPLITDLVELISSVSKNFSIMGLVSKLLDFLNKHVECNIGDIDLGDISNLIESAAELFEDGFHVENIGDILKIDIIKKYIKKFLAEALSSSSMKITEDDINVDLIADAINSGIRMAKDGVTVDSVIDTVISVLPKDLLTFDNGEINIQSIGEILKDVVNLIVNSIKHGFDYNELIDTLMDVFASDFVQSFVKDLLDIDADFDVQGLVDVLKDVIKLIKNSIEDKSVDTDKLVDIIMSKFIQDYLMDALGIEVEDSTRTNIASLLKQLINMFAEHDYSVETIVDIVTCDFIRDCIKDLFDITNANYETLFDEFGDLLSAVIGIIIDSVKSESFDLSSIADVLTSPFIGSCMKEILDIQQADSAAFDTRFGHFGDLLEDAIGLICDGSDDLADDIVNLVISDFVEDCVVAILGIEDTEKFGVRFEDFGELVKQIIGMIQDTDDIPNDVVGLVMSDFVKDCLEAALDVDDAHKDSFATRFHDFGSLLTQIIDIIESKDVSVESIADIVTSDFVKDCFKLLLEIDDTAEGYNDVDAFADLLNKVVVMIGEGVSIDGAIDIVMSDFVQNYVQKLMNLVTDGMSEEKKQEIKDTVLSLGDPLKQVINIIVTGVKESRVDVDAIVALINSDFVQKYIREGLGLIKDNMSEEELAELDETAEAFGGLIRQIVNAVIALVNIDPHGSTSEIADTVIDAVVGIFTNDFIQKYIQEAIGISEGILTADDIVSLGTLIQQVIGLITDDVTSDKLVALLKNDFIVKLAKKYIDLDDFDLTEDELDSVGDILTDALQLALGETPFSTDTMVDFMVNVATSDFIQKYLRDYFKIDEDTLSNDDITAIGELLKLILDMAVGKREINKSTASDLISEVVTNDFIQKLIGKFFDSQTDLEEEEVSALGDLLQMVLDIALGNTELNLSSSDGMIELLTDIFTNGFVQKYVQEYLNLDELGITNEDLSSFGDLLSQILKLALGEDTASVENIVGMYTNGFVQKYLRKALSIAEEDFSNDDVDDVAALLTKVLNMALGNTDVTVNAIVTLITDVVTNDFIQTKIREVLNTEAELSDDEIDALGELIQTVLNVALGETKVTDSESIITLLSDIFTNDFVQKYIRKYMKLDDLGDTEVEALDELIANVLELSLGEQSASIENIVSLVTNDFVQKYVRQFFDIDESKISSDDVDSLGELLTKVLNMVLGNTDVNAESVAGLVEEIITDDFVLDKIREFFNTEAELSDNEIDALGSLLKLILNVALGKEVEIDGETKKIAADSDSIIGLLKELLTNDFLQKFIQEYLNLDEIGLTEDEVTALGGLLEQVLKLALQEENPSVENIVGLISNEFVQKYIRECFDGEDLTDEAVDKEISAVTDLLTLVLNMALGKADVSVDNIVAVFTNDFIQKYVKKLFDGEDIYALVEEQYEKYKGEIEALGNLLKQIFNFATGKTTFNTDNAVDFFVGIFTNDYVQKYAKEYLEIDSDVLDSDDIVAIGDLIKQVIHMVKNIVGGSVTVTDTIDGVVNILTNRFIQKNLKTQFSIGDQTLNETDVADLLKKILTMVENSVENGVSVDDIVNIIMSDFVQKMGVGVSQSMDDDTKDAIVDVYHLVVTLYNEIVKLTKGELTKDSVVDSVSNIIMTDFVQKYIKDDVLSAVDEIKNKIKETVDIAAVKDVVKEIIAMIESGASEDSIRAFITSDFITEYVADGTAITANIDLDVIVKILKCGVDTITYAVSKHSFTPDYLVALLKETSVQTMIKKVLDITEEDEVYFNVIAELLKLGFRILTDGVSEEAIIDLVTDDSVQTLVKGWLQDADIDLDIVTTILTWGYDVIKASVASDRSVETILDAIMNESGLDVLADCLEIDTDTDVPVTLDDVTDILKWAVNTVVSSADPSTGIADFMKSFTDFITGDTMEGIFTKCFDLDEDSKAVDAIAEILNWGIDTIPNNFNATSVSELIQTSSVKQLIKDGIAKLVDEDEVRKNAVNQFDEDKRDSEEAKAAGDKAVADSLANIDSGIDAVSELLTWAIGLLTDAIQNGKFTVDSVTALLGNTKIRSFIKKSCDLADDDTTVETIAELLTWAVGTITASITSQSFDVKSIVNLLGGEYVQKFIIDGLAGLTDDKEIVNDAKALVKGMELTEDDEKILTEKAKADHKETYTNGVKAIVAFLDWGIDAVSDVMDGGFDVSSVATLLQNESVKSFLLTCINDLVRTDDIVEKTVAQAIQDDESVEDTYDKVKNAIDIFVEDNQTNIDAAIVLIDWAIQAVKTAVTDNKFDVSSVSTLLENDSIKQFLKESFDLDDDNSIIDAAVELLTWAVDTIPAAVKSNSFDISSVVDLLQRENIRNFIRDYILECSDTQGVLAEAKAIVAEAKDTVTEEVKKAKQEIDDFVEEHETGVNAFLDLIGWAKDMLPKAINGKFDPAMIVDLVTKDSVKDFILECVSDIADMDSIKADAIKGITDTAKQEEAAQKAVDKFETDSENGFEAAVVLVRWLIDVISTKSCDADAVTELIRDESILAFIEGLLELEDTDSTLDFVTTVLTWSVDTIDTAVTEKTFDVQSVLDLLEEDAVNRFIVDSIMKLSDSDEKTDAEEIAERKAFYQSGIDAIIELLGWSMDTANNVIAGTFDIDSIFDLVSNETIGDFVVDCINKLVDVEEIEEEAKKLGKDTEKAVEEFYEANERKIDSVIDIVSWIADTVVTSVESKSFDVTSIATLLRKDSVKTLLKEWFDFEQTDILDGVAEVITFVWDIVENKTLADDAIVSLMGNDAVQSMIQTCFDIDEEDVDLTAIAELLQWVGNTVVNAIDGEFDADSIAELVRNDAVQNLFINALDLQDNEDLDLDFIADLIDLCVGMITDGFDLDGLKDLITSDYIKGILKKYLPTIGDNFDVIAEVLNWCVSLTKEDFSMDKVMELIASDTVIDFVEKCFGDKLPKNVNFDAIADMLEGVMVIVQDILDDDFGVDSIQNLIDNDNIRSFINDCFDLESKDIDLDSILDLVSWCIGIVGEAIDGTIGVDDFIELVEGDTITNLVTKNFGVAAEKIHMEAITDILTWVLTIVDSKSISGEDIAELVENQNIQGLLCDVIGIQKDNVILKAVVAMIGWSMDIVDDPDCISGEKVSELISNGDVLALLCDIIGIKTDNVTLTAVIELLDWVLEIVDNKTVSADDFSDLIGSQNIQKFIKDSFDIDENNPYFDFVVDILQWSLNLVSNEGISLSDVTELIMYDSVENMIQKCLNLSKPIHLDAIAEVLDWIFDVIENGISVDDFAELLQKPSLRSFIQSILDEAGVTFDVVGIIDILGSTLNMIGEGKANREDVKNIVAGNFVKNVLKDYAGDLPVDVTGILSDLTDITFDIIEKTFGKESIVRIIRLVASQAISYTGQSKLIVGCVGVVARLANFKEEIGSAADIVNGVVDGFKEIGNKIKGFFTGDFDYADTAKKLLLSFIDKLLDKLGPYRDIFDSLIDMLKDDDFDIKKFGEKILETGLEAGKMTLDQLIYEYVRKGLVMAATLLDQTYEDTWDASYYPTYYLKAFGSEEELEQYIKETFTESVQNMSEDEKKEAYNKKDKDGNSVQPNTDGMMVKITGLIRQIGDGEGCENFIVDTSSEPAIINDTLCFEGSDLTFSEGAMSFGIGKITVGGVIQEAQKLYKSNTPLFDSLIMAGNGTLYLDSSGFTVHEGEWSIDFYDGFDKVLDPYTEEASETTDDAKESEEKKNKAPEDTSENGSTAWAIGGLGDLINPLRALAITDIYVNRHSLFSAPSFSVAGFSLKFDDYLLRSSQLCFGGHIDFKIVKGEIQSIFYNKKGLQAIEADLRIGIDKKLGLLGDGNSMNGLITVHYYSKDFKEQVVSRGKPEPKEFYSIQVDAELEKIGGVHVLLEFVRASNGRVLPDVIAFNMDFPDPGIMISGGTYLTAIRGAIRELAETIAGGSNDVPLTIEAGIDLKFGVKPAEFDGSIDLILKRTGFELNGVLNFNGKKMITLAQIKAQWVTPWFVSASMEVDVMGWGVVLGSFRLYIGQNLELHRTDFEGFISAKVCIPEVVPVVGGMPLAQVSFGVNNDKIWGSASIGISPVSIGISITYYFGGGIEFGTDGEGLPEAYNYLLVEKPEEEPVLLAIGSGMRTEATSFVNDNTIHEIRYCAVNDEMSLIDNGKNDIGIGGIEVSNQGKTHVIPVGTIDIDRDALIEVEYFGSKKTDDELTEMLHLTDENGDVLKLPNGKDYKLQIGDMTALKDGDTGFSQELTTEKDGVTRHLVYIMVPRNVFEGNDNIVLTSDDERIESKLLSTPIAPSVESIEISDYTDYADNGNQDDTEFDVAVTIDHPSENDIVNLYLTKEPMGTKKETHYDENGEPYEVTEANDPGVLIFKELPVVTDDASRKGYVNTHIDLANIEHNGIGDIRSVLESGEYYVRAELRSDTAYTASVSEDTIIMHDPLAPQSSVSNVVLERAGNGYFNLSFDKVDDAECYRFDFYDEEGELYGYYNGLIFESDDLDEYLNMDTGRYENLRLGGWTLNATPLTDEDNNIVYDEDGNMLFETDEDGNVKVKPSGLEIGEYYTVMVYAANQDGSGTYHYALPISNGENTLLPIPVKPQVVYVCVEVDS